MKITFKFCKKTLFAPTIIVLVAIMICNTSCKNKNKNLIVEQSQEIEVKESNHTWYYFSGDNYVKIDKPQNSPFCVPKPWTEATRISSAGTMAHTPFDFVDKAFAVVNRMGILCFENDKISLAKDENLFSNRTAGNLVFLNNTPIFSVYKSSFFNDTVTDPNYKNDNSLHFFLIQFDSAAKICYPIIHCNNLTDEPNSEITDYSWDGINWICSIKSITDVKNSFSYVTWHPNVSLLDLSPGTAKGNITVESSSQEQFRKSKTQLSFKNAPDRIKDMLSNFSDTTPFQLEVKYAGGTSSKIYLNEVKNSSKQELKAKGLISQSWSCVLFEDGTLFIEGALSEKHILREGKPVAIRLPKLPAGFIYSDFAISGTTLYVAWEESSFYTSSRSGFLQINLDKTLYSKIL